jgi:hypothetical protein
MDDNWGYVAVGYGLTAGGLAAYVAWLRVRIGRAERSSRDEADG